MTDSVHMFSAFVPALMFGVWRLVVDAIVRRIDADEDRQGDDQ